MATKAGTVPLTQVRRAPAHRTRLLAAHDAFVASGEIVDDLRTIVADSWRRCLQRGTDPEDLLAPVALRGDELEAARLAHPLVGVLPVIRRLLVDDAAEAGLLVAVSDAHGRLLWVEGNQGLRQKAESMHFAPGTLWSEHAAGTNAPGTALAIDQPVTIYAAEHLARQVVPWSCAAAPVHDPDTGGILGAIDVTGGDVAAADHTLRLVRATAVAVEAELRAQRLEARFGVPGPSRDTPATSAMLRTLGRPGAVYSGPAGSRALGLRHSEILLLLAEHPDGMSGDELAVALADDDVAAVTLRAEISRLRTLLGANSLGSRPYRLTVPVSTDVGDVGRALASGDLADALGRYVGQVLPRSDAPGVIRIRERLHEQVRASVLASGDATVLAAFGASDAGWDDWGVWDAALRVATPGSPAAVRARAHLAQLDRVLRSPLAR